MRKTVILDYANLPNLADLSNDLFAPASRLSDNTIPKMLKKYKPPGPELYYRQTKKVGTVYAILFWDWNTDKTSLEITLYFSFPEQEVMQIPILKATVTKLSQPEDHHKIEYNAYKRKVSWICSHDNLYHYFYGVNYDQSSLAKVAERKAEVKIREYYELMLAAEDIDLKIVFEDIGKRDKEPEKKAPDHLSWYFAYGPNLNPEIMRNKVSGWLAHFPAELRSYELSFSVMDAYNPYVGWPTIEHTNDDVTIYGSVYLLNSIQRKELDVAEECPLIYSAHGIHANINSDNLGVFIRDGHMITGIVRTYFGKKEYIGKNLKPYKETIKQILQAGDDILPPDYIKWLKKIKTFD
jgi:hypothetical protein